MKEIKRAFVLFPLLDRNALPTRSSCLFGTRGTVCHVQIQCRPWSLADQLPRSTSLSLYIFLSCNCNWGLKLWCQPFTANSWTSEWHQTIKMYYIYHLGQMREVRDGRNKLRCHSTYQKIPLQASSVECLSLFLLGWAYIA